MKCSYIATCYLDVLLNTSLSCSCESHCMQASCTVLPAVCLQQSWTGCRPGNKSMLTTQKRKPSFYRVLVVASSVRHRLLRDKANTFAAAACVEQPYNSRTWSDATARQATCPAQHQPTNAPQGWSLAMVTIQSSYYSSSSSTHAECHSADCQW